MKHPITTITLILALFATTTALAADGDLGEWSTRLAELRSQVERLSGEVEDKKAEIDARLRSTRSQKADLEVQIKREETRLGQLRRAVDEHRERIEEHEAGREDLAPTVVSAIGSVRQTVETSLPFKRAERLGELDKLEEQLDEGLVTPQKATARLWQFVEDELRLARENGLYRQVVEVDGDEVLADVARVGMVAIYYKTEDGRVGMARRHKDKWRWQPLDAEADRERVHTLFDAFQKNIRVGFFELPGGFSSRGTQ